MKRFLATSCFLTLTLACSAIDVGIFSNTRLYSAAFNLQTGGSMSILRTDWEARGAVWHQTGTITASFLATVKVFFTSSLNMTSFTAAEKTAMIAWVKAGGTLIVTGEDSGHGSQAAYNSLLDGFSVSIAGSVTPGTGTIINSDPIFGSATSVYLGGNGILAATGNRKKLLKDHLGNLAALSIEYTPEVGNGRLVVIGDTDMFTDTYMLTYEENEAFFKGIAYWAANPPTYLAGTVNLAAYFGPYGGVPLKMQIMDGQFEVELVEDYVGSNGNYLVQIITNGGPYDVVAKCPQWTSLRAESVTLTPGVNLINWDFLYNGDANHDNSIDLNDISAALVNFGEGPPNSADVDGDEIVGLPDINLMLINFAVIGE